MHAQTAAPDLPVNHVDAGGFYSPTSATATTSGASLFGAYSHNIGGSTYSYTVADVTFQPITKANALHSLTQPKISTTSGLAQLLTTFSGWNIFGIGAVGLQSTPGGGTAAGFSATAGFMATHPIGTKGCWTLDVPVRVIAGTGAPQYVFGLGFGYGCGK
jgi:hypothetical protein